MRGLSHWAKSDQRFALGAEERRKPQHVRSAEQIGQNIGDDRAVLQRIAAARRSLRAVGQHPPLAVRRARQIDRQHMQIAMRGNAHAHQRPQKRRVRIQQRGRKLPVRDQLLRAVQVLKNQIQQLGALNNALLR